MIGRPAAKLGPVPVVPLNPPYVAMFNPENWQIQHGVEYCSDGAPGSAGAESSFIKVMPTTLSFDLVVDGTGASGEKREVLVDILHLKRVLLFNGILHKPNQLLIVWGSQIFKGILTSMTVKHSLFRSNSTPLRSTVTLSFKEQNSVLGVLLGMNLGSADLTHRRLTKEGERIDAICAQIYDDSRHYIDVASANNLTSFRKLPVGTELVYPPVEK